MAPDDTAVRPDSTEPVAAVTLPSERKRAPPPFYLALIVDFSTILFTLASHVFAATTWIMKLQTKGRRVGLINESAPESPAASSQQQVQGDARAAQSEERKGGEGGKVGDKEEERNSDPAVAAGTTAALSASSEAVALPVAPAPSQVEAAVSQPATAPSSGPATVKTPATDTTAAGAGAGAVASADAAAVPAGAAAGAATATTSGGAAAAAAAAAEPVTCKVASLSWAGQKNGFKKPNQDAYCFMRTKDKKSLLFAVFDGHGPRGHDVSQHLKTYLPDLLMAHPSLLSDTRTAMRECFLEAHEAVVNGSEVDCTISGTTAVVAHLFNRRLTVAWAGDSRAVIARSNVPPPGNGVRDGGASLAVSANELTDDHKPERDGEKERIFANDGSVYREVDGMGNDVGPYRVWMNKGPMLGLAMSRSLGDRLAHTVGVIAEPEVVEYDLSPDDKFLVLASDGVWEFVSCEDSVALVHEELSKAEAERKESSSSSSSSNAKVAATPATAVTTGAASGVTVAAGAAAAVPTATAAAAPGGGGKVRKGKRQGPGNPLEGAVKRLMTVSRDRWLERDQGAYVDDITALLVAFTHHEV